MAVALATWVACIMHLLVGGNDQPCCQHRKLLKGQSIVLVRVQVLQDVIYECNIPFLLLWVK